MKNTLTSSRFDRVHVKSVRNSKPIRHKAKVCFDILYIIHFINNTDRVNG